jgi:tetratricopeptide (TPR) repeat protein
MFQQIKERYTNSNSAPAAYYYIGEIYLAKRNFADLDEAYASFERVTRVFPSSEWVDKSLVGSGLALKWRGEFDRAYEEFSKMKIRFALSPLAPVAQYEMGICSLYSNSYLEASYDFQQVIDRFPNSEYAKHALDFNTILYRLYVAPASDKNPYRPDVSYSGVLREIDEPTAMAVDSKGNLYLSDKGKKLVYTFDPTGKMIDGSNVPSIFSLGVDSRDNLLITTETSVILPDKTSQSFTIQRNAKPQPLGELRSVIRNPFGDYFVVSNQVSGIHAFDPKGGNITTNTLANTEKEYVKVLINQRNEIYALDKQHKQIVAFSPEGKTLFGIGTVGKSYEVERIDDFDIDPANHLYVLTKNPRGVFIFSPSGNLLRYVSSIKKDVNSFEDAKVLAVGPSGALYILDKNLRKIVKLG